MKKFFFLLVFLLFFFSNSSATDWYVSQNDAACGDTQNHGTQNQPFCTIASANTYHQAGDTVYILQGDYRERLIMKAGIGENQRTQYIGLGNREEIFILGSEEVTGWTQCSAGDPNCAGVGNNVYYADFTAQLQRWEKYVGESLQEVSNPSTGTTDCFEDRERSYWRADLVDVYPTQPYIIYKHANFSDYTWVDEPGEFYYDYSSHLLYVWPYDSQNANNHLIECI